MIGTRSLSLLIRVKSGTLERLFVNFCSQDFFESGVLTLESNRLAYALLPTRGVPYVTPLMWTLLGRFSVMKRESSSANAPPREWPIWKVPSQPVASYVTAQSLTRRTESAPLVAMSRCVSARTVDAVFSCSSANPL